MSQETLFRSLFGLLAIFTFVDPFMQISKLRLEEGGRRDQGGSEGKAREGRRRRRGGGEAEGVDQEQREQQGKKKQQDEHKTKTTLNILVTRGPGTE